MDVGSCGARSQGRVRNMINRSQANAADIKESLASSRSTIDDLEVTLRKPDMQSLLARIADRAVELISTDVEVLAPRRSETGRTNISDWFKKHDARFIQIVLDAFRQELPDIAAKREDDLRQFALENLWPLIRPELHKYALRRIAIRWAARQYSDSTIVLPPEAHANGWRLPLRISGGETDMGQIVLDNEGNIDVGQTTSRADLRELLGNAA